MDGGSRLVLVLVFGVYRRHPLGCLLDGTAGSRLLDAWRMLELATDPAVQSVFGLHFCVWLGGGGVGLRRGLRLLHLGGLHPCRVCDFHDRRRGFLLGARIGMLGSLVPRGIVVRGVGGLRQLYRGSMRSLAPPVFRGHRP
jgi:hypothetical protein